MATTTAPAAPSVPQPLVEVAREYDADPEKLAGYAALLTVYGTAIAGFSAVPAPDRSAPAGTDRTGATWCCSVRPRSS